MITTSALSPLTSLQPRNDRREDVDPAMNQSHCKAENLVNRHRKYSTPKLSIQLQSTYKLCKLLFLKSPAATYTMAVCKPRILQPHFSKRLVVVKNPQELLRQPQIQHCSCHVQSRLRLCSSPMLQGLCKSRKCRFIVRLQSVV